jgi:hypothetical protein
MAKRFAHAPKIICSSRKHGQVWYIEYCEDGMRRYQRAHDGVCTCPGSTGGRPCTHLALAMVMLGEVEGGARTGARIPVDLSPEAVCERFRAYRSDGSLSPGTLTGYTYSIRYLVAFLAARGITRCSQLTRRLMREYRAHLESRGYSDHYRNHLLRDARAIFFWAVREGFMRDNPLSGANLPLNEKIIRRSPRNLRERNPLTDEEIERLLSGLSGDDREEAVAYLSLPKTRAHWFVRV